MGKPTKNPRGKKKRKEITIVECHAEICKIIERCNGNGFEILGVLSRLSMEYRDAWEDFMVEQEEGMMDEGEDDVETRPPIGSSQPLGFAGKKFDAMYA